MNTDHLISDAYHAVCKFSSAVHTLMAKETLFVEDAFLAFVVLVLLFLTLLASSVFRFKL